ncbi:hypothetical protein LINPERHAP2_LOCUS41246 [Linum perenne]
MTLCWNSSLNPM